MVFVIIQVSFLLRRLRRRGWEEKRDALMHPPDARPRAPAKGVALCTPFPIT